MLFDRITVDPVRMNGQPCIRSMRLTVRRVVELAAFYPNREELRLEYPELEDEDIRQALLYAAAHLDDRVLDLRLSHETAARSGPSEIGGKTAQSGRNRHDPYSPFTVFGLVMEKYPWAMK